MLSLQKLDVMLENILFQKCQSGLVLGILNCGCRLFYRRELAGANWVLNAATQGKQQLFSDIK